jgi:hypothetical protein
MWKRRRPEAEEDDEVVIDLRDRLEPYANVEPAAVEALRHGIDGDAEADDAESPWAIPSDWLRAP